MVRSAGGNNVNQNQTEIEKKKEYLKGYEKAKRQMERSELRIKEMRLNRICPSVIMMGCPTHRVKQICPVMLPCWIRKKNGICGTGIRGLGSVKRLLTG